MQELQSNVSLLPYNTFHIDVKAKYFVEIHSEEELQELFASDIFKREKRLLLWGGANVLFTGDVDGIVIKVEIKGIQQIAQDERTLFIRVGAGEEWSARVEYANTQGRAGIENLIAIPGKVGTAPISNIWAYGVEVGNLVVQVEGYDLQTGEKKSYTHDACAFAYRNSIFKSQLRNQFLITSVVFALQQFDEKYVFTTGYPDVQAALEGKPPHSLRQLSETIASLRAKKLPDWRVTGTAGSFFANPFVCMEHFEALKKAYPEMPFWEVDASLQSEEKEVVKLSAGRLIEKAGLKGYSNGKAGTSPHHALIVINEWGTASDVLEVVEHIQQVVKEKFGVALKPEVVYV